MYKVHKFLANMCWLQRQRKAKYPEKKHRGDQLHARTLIHMRRDTPDLLRFFGGEMHIVLTTCPLVMHVYIQNFPQL